MHESHSVTWREVAEKHHAAFIDEMQSLYDASMRAAVTRAVEEARQDAQKVLANFKSDFEQRYEAALQQARKQAEDAIAEQRATAERDRQRELNKLQAESQAALADMQAAFELTREADREQARKAVRQSFSEQWNQVLRRLRLCDSPDAVFEFLVDAAASYAGHVVVLSFENNLVRVGQGRNVSEVPTSEFPVSDAPAVLSVIETRDPVVALAVENEISSVVSRVLKPAVGEKAYLFPLRGRQAVMAALVAYEDVSAGALELLCEAAGFQLEVLAGGRVTDLKDTRAAAPGWAEEPVQKESLVQIGTHTGTSSETAQGKAPASERKAWDQLNAAEQKLHLQAQRFARVQVAEMRLYQPEAVRRGIADKELYPALKSEIDEARKQFLHRFLSISSSMVDYLHLEILRSLAHDDDRLLGHDYPGPMA